ncbi:hypothetical protein T4B_9981 [Trichinella pseudospiralis]|uniref:Uncharacterized protein n=1 Tax=Trichinella pseudospiralis TaxID=6337 RepID=A0A0V1JG97_TRIPS|nr:hypothetical protein T4B_9981 [Trichinella pseudospiralis]
MQATIETVPIVSRQASVPKRQTPQWRLCGDYRGLNCCITTDRYPLPNLADFAHNLHGCTYYPNLA